MTPEEIPRGLLGLRKAWRALAAQLEAKPSTLALKVLDTPELLAEQSARTCTLVVIHDQGRQVGRSAGRQVGTFANGPARSSGWNHLGGDARLGPRRASNTP